MEHRGLGKVIWFARRFGLRAMAEKAALSLFAPRRTRSTFNFFGESYRYFDHPYNWTWTNERCVEIPIVLRAIRGVDPGRVLEIGNVLSHYVEVSHRVIDKYEGPEKLDAIELADRNRYDRIISISTFEHIGFDEPERDPYKALRVIDVCRRALRPQGLLLFTVPCGYNPDMDWIAGSTNPNFLMRTTRNEWAQVAKPAELSYGWPFPYANQIAVAAMIND